MEQGPLIYGHLIYFIFGMICMSCVVISLFFLKFYSRTKDRLLLLFSIGFAMLAVERVFLTLSTDQSEARSYIYLIRLVAFGLIIYGIVEKNRVPKLEREPKGSRV